MKRLLSYQWQLFLDRKPIVMVQTDACYDGMGALYAGHWTYVHFVSALPIAKDLHTNYKETLAIIMAAEFWGQLGVINISLFIVITNLQFQSSTRAVPVIPSLCPSYTDSFGCQPFIISGFRFVTFLA